MTKPNNQPRKNTEGNCRSHNYMFFTYDCI